MIGLIQVPRHLKDLRVSLAEVVKEELAKSRKFPTNVRRIRRDLDIDRINGAVSPLVKQMASK